jgi:hypothetical protein
MCQTGNLEIENGKIYGHQKTAASKIIDSFKDLSRAFSGALDIMSWVKMLGSTKSVLL